jgi:hypothetical protein
VGRNSNVIPNMLFQVLDVNLKGTFLGKISFRRNKAYKFNGMVLNTVLYAERAI